MRVELTTIVTDQPNKHKVFNANFVTYDNRNKTFVFWRMVGANINVSVGEIAGLTISNPQQPQPPSK